MSESQGQGWPRRKMTSAAAPNIIVILTDDVGYGACSTFGGPIQTPNLDKLAGGGLRFTQFHTTAMCSPTRAALLTGRNQHRVGMGRVTARPSSYDGYTSVIPKSAGTVARILSDAGYNTAMFGKWHLAPEWEMSPLGPFDRWPTGMGFDYYYGFLGYDTNMWAPDLVENTSYVESQADTPPKHFDEVMADKAIQWIAQQKAIAPENAFFVYYASGTAHSPHHAPKEWLEKYRGKFDGGWDCMRVETFQRQKDLGVIRQDATLTERPTNLPAWDSLTPDQRRLAARLMEAYAGALDHFDHQVGRILQFLETSGQLENTLVLFIQGDNGGSAEGGLGGLLFEQSWTNGFEEKLEDQLSLIDEIGSPSAYNHFPAAWGWAINCPFKYYKQVASHFGGTRNGLVISWPDRIRDAGGIRPQFHHVVDILPTILEAAGVEAPRTIDGIAQDSIDGVSMFYAINDGAAAPSRKTQIFESMQNFGIYDEGWLACSTPENDPWESFSSRKSIDPGERRWELYRLASDFSQAFDLANDNPDRLAQLQSLFWKEAGANKVLPIHSPSQGGQRRPSLAADRSEFIFRRPLRRVNADAAPHTVGRSFRIECDVVVGPSGGHGVIACHGGSTCGYSFYLSDGRPSFFYNAIRPYACRIQAPSALTSGRHSLAAVVRLERPEPGAAATVVIEVDGRTVAEGRIERTLKTFLNQNGFNVGSDSVSAVSPDYSLEDSEFDGELSPVVVRLF
jgi:arylsulfatase A-like enzyme